jgi:small conductance mechanosensitive channel
MDELKEVEFPIESVESFLVYWAKYGQQLLVTLVVLVAGILIIQRIGPILGRLLARTGLGGRMANEVVMGIYVLLGVMLVGVVLWNLGIGGSTVRQLLMAGGLITAAVLLLLRPYLPKMPFRVGNLIKTGNLTGKVESISLVNTRLRTFDGLIVVVPNAKILQDYVQNYHETPTRRIKVDVAIRYDQDIVYAKRIIEEILVQDPRTLPTPRPVVYTTNLADSWVQLGGRAWVKNPKAWATRCDVLEKVKYRFGHEGIDIAFPRTDVHITTDGSALGVDQLPQEELVARMLAEDSGKEASA